MPAKPALEKFCVNMAFACRYCILTEGLRGDQISSLPQSEEELFDHIRARSSHPRSARRRNRRTMFSSFPSSESESVYALNADRLRTGCRSARTRAQVPALEA